MNKAELQEFREALLLLQARIRGDVEHLRDGALNGGNGHRETKSPTHIAELGTETYEQDFSLRVAENDQEVLEEITAALGRIEAGSYGLCEACQQAGKPASKAAIKKARLRAIPHARNCIECERKREGSAA
ncbi:MAG: TraR/DksA family transcriptional regulator [Planctomycetaceae bacterium]